MCANVQLYVSGVVGCQRRYRHWFCVQRYPVCCDVLERFDELCIDSSLTANVEDCARLFYAECLQTHVIGVCCGEVWVVCGGEEKCCTFRTTRSRIASGNAVHTCGMFPILPNIGSSRRGRVRSQFGRVAVQSSGMEFEVPKDVDQSDEEIHSFDCWPGVDVGLEVVDLKPQPQTFGKYAHVEKPLSGMGVEVPTHFVSSMRQVFHLMSGSFFTQAWNIWV